MPQDVGVGSTSLPTTVLPIVALQVMHVVVAAAVVVVLLRLHRPRRDA